MSSKGQQPKPFEKFSGASLSIYVVFALIDSVSPDLESKVAREALGAFVGVLLLTGIAYFYSRLRRQKGPISLQTSPALDVPKGVQTIPDLLVWGGGVLFAYLLLFPPLVVAPLIASALFAYASPGSIPKRKLVVGLGLALVLYVGLWAMAYGGEPVQNVAIPLRVLARILVLTLGILAGTLVGGFAHRMARRSSQNQAR